MVTGPPKQRFLVLYDYGMGGLWAYLYAGSEDQIERDHPELEVVEDVPLWMTEETRGHVEKNATFDIDAPVGWLAISEKDQSR